MSDVHEIRADYRHGDVHKVQCICGWVSDGFDSLHAARSQHRLHEVTANPTPQMQPCQLCGDPLGAMQTMQAVVADTLVKPLCSICYDRLGGTP